MLDTLQDERAGRRTAREGLRLRGAFRRDEDLAGRGLRFKPGGEIDGATDRGEVAADGREFADLDLAGVNADADTERIHRIIQTSRHGGERCLTALLYVEGGQYRRLRVALDLDRKVEDRHQTVAHLLVDDAVVRPDALGTLILEGADDVAQLYRVHPFGEPGISADVGEKDGCNSRDVAALFNPAEGMFADRANVRVHLALREAEDSERHRERTADWNWHPHLIPATPADA